MPALINYVRADELAVNVTDDAGVAFFVRAGADPPEHSANPPVRPGANYRH
jgi:hypothetical protein